MVYAAVGKKRANHPPRQSLPWDHSEGSTLEGVQVLWAFPLLSIRNISRREHIGLGSETDWSGYNKSFIPVECEWTQPSVSYGAGIVCSGCVPHIFYYGYRISTRKNLSEGINIQMNFTEYNSLKNVKLIILGNEWWRGDPMSHIWAHLFCTGLLPVSEDLIALDNPEHSTERKCICSLDGCAWWNPWPRGGWNDLQRTSEQEEAEAGWRDAAQGPPGQAGPLAQFTDG